MDFISARNQVDKFLKNIKVMFLATANTDGEPSLRQMSIIHFNDKIYFQTSENFDKTKELLSNPHVALGIGAYSFKGVAKFLGSPSDNLDIMNNFKLVHPDAYKNYSFLDDEILFEVKINECKIWNGKDVEHDGKETITTIDFEKQEVSHKFCK